MKKKLGVNMKLKLFAFRRLEGELEVPDNWDYQQDVWLPLAMPRPRFTMEAAHITEFQKYLMKRGRFEYRGSTLDKDFSPHYELVEII
jgi:hypothetical protein